MKLEKPVVSSITSLRPYIMAARERRTILDLPKDIQEKIADSLITPGLRIFSETCRELNDSSKRFMDNRYVDHYHENVLTRGCGGSMIDTLYMIRNEDHCTMQ